MNYYPEQLKAILGYIDALNAAEKDLEGEGLPYPKFVALTDEHGTDYGQLRDEVGGAWSWFPKAPE